MLVTLCVVGALAALLGLWGLVRSVRNEPVVGKQIPAMAVVEVALLAQCALVAYWQGSGLGKGDPLVLWGYLITELILLPVAFGWSFLERTRWSSAGLALVGVVIAVLQVRVWQIWQGQG